VTDGDKTLMRLMSDDAAELSPHRLLADVVAALRGVIGPAIGEPYPKAQAYMAAVVLEFVSRQVEARRDIQTEKARLLDALFHDLPAVLAGAAGGAARGAEAIPEGGYQTSSAIELLGAGQTDSEARLTIVIEWLYAERDRLGPERFTAANTRIRQTLRALLDHELKVVGNARD
jgi:hypothetical protein